MSLKGKQHAQRVFNLAYTLVTLADFEKPEAGIIGGLIDELERNLAAARAELAPPAKRKRGGR
jgi:hypothetical protein